jgi:hypothetical protein
MIGILQTAGLALALIVSGADAQIPGTTEALCSCSPTVFNFTLDFTASCPGNLVDADGDPINGAINDLSCFTTVVAEDASNRQPVIVDTVTILELNMEEVINSTNLNGPFEDGDVITYASISSYANLTEAYFPFGIQMILSGENSDGATVINAVAIEYTNNCDEWPVYPTGSSIGWVGIVSHCLIVEGCGWCNVFVSC